MQFFRGFKDDTILWFIILFVLLFFCGNCGRNDCCDECGMIANTSNCCCD